MGLTADKWPWYWTLAVALERRWRSIRELEALDENGNGVPMEWWHDADYVNSWIETKRAERRAKIDSSSGIDIK